MTLLLPSSSFSAVSVRYPKGLNRVALVNRPGPLTVLDEEVSVLSTQAYPLDEVLKEIICSFRMSVLS